MEASEGNVRGVVETLTRVVEALAPSHRMELQMVQARRPVLDAFQEVG